MSTFRKSPVSLNEVRLQYQAQLKCSGLSPTIRDFGENDDGTLWMTMDEITSKCIAEKYGEDARDVPDWIWNEIHHIIRKLYYAGQMEYIDITPYNFIEHNGSVWCIDYGHATHRSEGIDAVKNWFLAEFLEDGSMRKWNPDFR